MSIVSISEAEAYLGVASGTDTTLITNLISYSQALVENYTGNKFDQTDIKGEVLEFGISKFDQAQQELIDLSGHNLAAFTRYIPISSVTVYDGDEALVVDEDYKIVSSLGKIELYTDVSDYAQNLTIDYTYGYATAPSDLKFVVLDLVSKMYANHGAEKGEGDIESKKLGDFSVSYRTAGTSLGEYKSILNKYIIINI